MTGRPSSRSLVLAVLFLTTVLAGCQVDRSPRRVPDDGASCSAVMPGAPKTGQERTFRLASVVVTERAWSLGPPDASVDPKDVTTYFVRRVTVPAGAPLRDAALLDAAAARVVRGIELEAGTKPTVAKVPTAGGDAIDLHWTPGTRHSATRLLLMPGGYCEVTITFAAADASVASYLASAQGQARP